MIGCPNLAFDVEGPLGQSRVHEDLVDEEGYGVVLSAVQGQGTYVRTMTENGWGSGRKVDLSTLPERKLEELNFVESTLGKTSLSQDEHKAVCEQLGAQWPGTVIWAQQIKHVALALGSTDVMVRIPKTADRFRCSGSRMSRFSTRRRPPSLHRSWWTDQGLQRWGHRLRPGPSHCRRAQLRHDRGATVRVREGGGGRAASPCSEIAVSCFGKEWNATRKDSHAVRDESWLEPRSHSSQGCAVSQSLTGRSCHLSDELHIIVDWRMPRRSRSRFTTPQEH